MKHGDSPHGKRAKEYTCWIMMKQRCLSANHPQWGDYGGRGISVCKRWLDERNGYTNFLSDVGRAPTSKHTIDRINNDKGYKPSNVKWSTRQEQIFNRRENFHKLLGQRINLRKESRGLGGASNLVSSRISAGWDLATAISTPASRTSNGKYGHVDKYIDDLPDGLTRKTVIERLANGWDLSEAVSVRKQSIRHSRKTQSA